MTQLSSNRTPRRGRIFPERQLSPEEKARHKAEDEVFYQRCRIIFDRVQPELIKGCGKAREKICEQQEEKHGLICSIKACF
ncbi:MAG: hypothetical protein ACHBN1_20725 [Heteroscytonema crispum UTEX LB 1556]